MSGSRQLQDIKMELAAFGEHFPKETLAELAADKLHACIRRGGVTLKTQNNRRAVTCAFFNHAVQQEWISLNPVAKIQRHRIDHGRGSAPALRAAQAAELMAHVEGVHDGAFVPFFALCLFAGIRPNGEIGKLPAADVRLETSAITIGPWVSKVGMRRLVSIRPNLGAWLRAYPPDKYPILPPKDKMKNVGAKFTAIRKHFKLAHDVLRHTFISMHVAKFRSMGDTTLQAGNSEGIIRWHYLNVATPQEAGAFFNILPTRAAKPTSAVSSAQPSLHNAA